MTRILFLATLSAAQVCATTISTSSACPVFTSGHMTISNCQASTTGSFISGVGFPGDLSLVPQLPNPAPNGLVMRVDGASAFVLTSNPDEAQFVEWTLAADFLMDPQWRMSSVAMSFNVGNDGTSVSVNANLGASNSQCVSVGGSNTIGGFCVPLTPAQSGTITLTLDLRSDKVCPTCFTDSSGFGNGAITLNQVFVPDSVPEPSTIVLLG